MIFSCSGKDLTSSLTKLQGIIGKPINAVYFNATNDRHLECHAEANGRRGLVIIDAAISKQGNFLINKPDIDAIAKNRTVLHFKKATNLSFKNGSYHGQIPLLPIPEKSNFNILKPADFKVSQFNEKLLEEIKLAISMCQLQNVYNTEKLTLFIQSHNSKIYVGVGDQLHAALITISDNITEDNMRQLATPILLPIEYSKIWASYFKSGETHITNKSNYIRFDDSKTSVELPTLQTQSSILLELLAITSKNQYMINADELSTILQNNPLQNSDLFFIFKKNSKELKIKFKADHGFIEDAVAIKPEPKHSKKIKVDIRNLLDVSKKLKGNIYISYNKSMIKLEQDQNCFYSQLLQLEEENV